MSLTKKHSYQLIKNLMNEIAGVFVGKNEPAHYMVTGLLSGLHVLIEDIPGVGKTTLAKALAKSADLDFGRIQFTPDLLPGDVIGMTVWSVEKKDFIFKPGAIMHQFILADEINRANSRTQSSLLEAMQEESVTVDGNTYMLPDPFIVVATQNPFSFAGTFMLPEAQIDRFGISFTIGYPSEKDEVKILEKFKAENPFDSISPVITTEQIREIKKMVSEVYVDDKIKKYIIRIANATRSSARIRLGMSPRASQHLQRASQAEAYISQRDFVIPEDVINTSGIVLPHRVITSSEAKLENISPAEIISELIEKTPIPSGIKFKD